MQQASSLWQRWTSATNAAQAESPTSKNTASSSLSELNATPDLTSDKGDSNFGLDGDDDAASGSEKANVAGKSQLSPPIHPHLDKEGTRNNSTSSGSSHQTFSSIPGPSERQSPVQRGPIQPPSQQVQQQQQQQQPEEKTAINTSAAASNSNEDFFFQRDPLLLPRRNHTIGAGTTPNRKRINSHFLFPSEGPTSPGQNSLSAITGGRDTDDDEWEKAIKSREDLIPGMDDDLINDNRYASDAAPWQTNSSLAAISHRRFPSQPSSVRAGSPYHSNSHSPLQSRGSYHQRSESAQVRRLEQGPFASASVIGHSPESSQYSNIDSGMIRRHQSLNHTTGRAMAGRMQNSSRRNLYADRIGAIDIDRLSPTASFTRETGTILPEQQNVYVAAAAAANSLTPAERSILASAGYISPEAALESNSTSSTALSTSLLDAHARLSRMSLQPSTTPQQTRDSIGNLGPAKESDGETRRHLHSLVTNRDILERSAMYGSQNRRGDFVGPASASAYVPPIGHGHHRRDQSPSNSPIGSLAKSDELIYRHAAPTLQGPFTALPGHAPWLHQVGPSLLNKPSTMGIHHLETAREESPRMDSMGFDSPSQHQQHLYQSEREDQSQQNNINNMAMNITLLQQRLLSQQQQQHHHIPNTQIHQQQQHHQPLTNYNSFPQPAPLHFSMNDPRQSGAPLNPYNTMSMEVQQYNRTYSPQISNNLQSMFQSPPPGNMSLPVKGVAPSASQIISPALAAQIAEKGYNPTTNQFDITTTKARFFVIKSFTEDDVQRSLKHEIWASTEKGNQRLDKAFKECLTAGGVPLYLFYSVNASGHFCGMAQMMSPLDYSSTSNVWVQEGKWKGTFKVKWIFVKDVPNVKLRHIKLTNTVEQKPVTQSRDTQELPIEGGKEVLKIMAEYQSKTTLLQDWLFYEQQAAIHQQRKDGPSFSTP